MQETRGDTVLLRLLPAPGVRINARLTPALERPDGTVLRFQGTTLTLDSAYFATPPLLAVRGSARGTVRASICPAGDSVCRMEVLAVEQ